MCERGRARTLSPGWQADPKAARALGLSADGRNSQLGIAAHCLERLALNPAPCWRVDRRLDLDTR